MVRVAQFGEGNFLRAFADVYFEQLNRAGGAYAVSIMKPTPGELPAPFAQRNGRYHVVLRGVRDGAVTEEVIPVSAVDRVFSPCSDRAAFTALATDPALQLIVSNTTEAGICFRETDGFDDFDTMTFPGRLTRFLLERFLTGGAGVYLLPVELIEHNADELYRCVDAYSRLWGLPTAFRQWNDTQNYYCNTLVDRIVSGFPRDGETRAHLTDLVGEPDELLTVGEPYGLWVIQRKGHIDKVLPAGRHNIEVVLTDDISYYKKRKVRVLNGSHTNLTPVGLLLGKETVYDCMTDERLYRFFRETLCEIIPLVAQEEEPTRQFASDVEQRFRNPFLNHRLSGIALNSISKWRARNLPAFRDYYTRHGSIPPHMTVGFSYLMYLYMTRYDTLQDDPTYLVFFARGGSVRELMQNADMWGEDLTAYNGFAEAVVSNIEDIGRGEVLI